MSGWLEALTIAGIVGTGLAGGVFFAFSTFVMDGLRRLPPAHGIGAMQSINRAAPTPAFMLALFGTALLCAALIAGAIVDADAGVAAWLIAGGALYIIGAIGVTIAFHIPRNNALARVDPYAPDAPERWRRYAFEWTGGNHVRTGACLAAAALLALGLRAG